MKESTAFFIKLKLDTNLLLTEIKLVKIERHLTPTMIFSNTQLQYFVQPGMISMIKVNTETEYYVITQ